MKIKWLGHSCFKIAGSNGTRILTDPFDDNVGYSIPSVETDIITISHNHYDHNYVDCVRGNFEVVTRPGNHTIKGVSITGVHTFHDGEGGAKRGSNIVYIFEIDGIRICHLGDLGHMLTDAQKAEIGRVDVLLTPVGGIYTLNADDAWMIMDQLDPKIVIPMHYKTPALRFELDKVDAFLEKASSVEHINKQVVEINQEELAKGAKRVFVLNYE